MCIILSLFLNCLLIQFISADPVELQIKKYINFHHFVQTDAEKAGRVSFVMCVNSIHPVNMVPVMNRGSASARRAGEASSVTKVCSTV